jgi:preprotein translocase subunit SecA
VKALDAILVSTLDRLQSQVKQRVEEAELAVQGVLLEAEEQEMEPDPRSIVQALERVAGLRLQLDAAGLEQLRQDPARLQRMLPDLVEASLGVRAWAGVVQAMERRLGESLGLEAALKAPIDWDQAEDQLRDALRSLWERRQQETQADLQRDLTAWIALGDPADPALRVRLLVRMSYGQRAFFDRRTHQKRSVMVARLMYPFFAVELLPTLDSRSLADDILEHLERAHEALYASLGSGELRRLQDPGADGPSEEQADLLSRARQAEDGTALPEGPVADWPDPARQAAAPLLGRLTASHSYRRLILSVGDRLWVDYLTQMEALRTSIGLEAYGQRDPLVQYKSRASDMFRQLMHDIRAGVISRIFRLGAPAPASPPAAAETARPPAAGNLAAPQAQLEAQGGKRKRRRH